MKNKRHSSQLRFRSVLYFPSLSVKELIRLLWSIKHLILQSWKLRTSYPPVLSTVLRSWQDRIFAGAKLNVNYTHWFKVTAWTSTSVTSSTMGVSCPKTITSAFTFLTSRRSLMTMLVNSVKSVYSRQKCSSPHVILSTEQFSNVIHHTCRWRVNATIDQGKIIFLVPRWYATNSSKMRLHLLRLNLIRNAPLLLTSTLWEWEY